MRLLFPIVSLLAGACASAAPNLANERVAMDPAAINADFPPGMTGLRIDSHGDDMNGHIYLADGPGPHPTVVMLHGFPGNEKNLDLAHAIRRAGWNAVFFHYRGAWGSDGAFLFSSAIYDVASALSYLRDPSNDQLRIDPDRIALVGHSMGGFTALHGGARDEGVRCIVGMAAANLGDGTLATASPEALEGFKQYSDQLTMLNEFSGDGAVADIIAAGERFNNRLLASDLSGKKVFLIAAERDQAVDISVHEGHMRAFLDAGDIEVTELRLDADHSFSWHRVRLANEISTWLNRECH